MNRMNPPLIFTTPCRSSGELSMVVQHNEQTVAYHQAAIVQGQKTLVKLQVPIWAYRACRGRGFWPLVSLELFVRREQKGILSRIYWPIDQHHMTLAEWWKYMEEDCFSRCHCWPRILQNSQSLATSNLKDTVDIACIWLNRNRWPAFLYQLQQSSHNVSNTATNHALGTW